MELKFETLDYQQDAVNAVVRLFTGQPETAQTFELQNHASARFVANGLALDWETVGQNLNAVQRDFGLPETEIGRHGLNFSVEMETGTGKTYVYLRTILELNRCYGWKKFVIVVPSVAIREGVLHSLNSTRAHFDELFDKPVVHFSEYRSDRLSALRSFAVNNHIEILVMNIDAFAKDENVINQVRENGEAPIEHIRQTRPIVIIDEPQNMETEKRLSAIESLNPLFTLRYSATHKDARHKVYSLNPVQAYNQKLVKQIEVCSVLAENDVNGAFVELLEVFYAGKSKRLSAKLNIHYQDKTETKKKTVTVKRGDDLFEKSGGNEAYRHGFTLDGLDFTEQCAAFSGSLNIGRENGNDSLRDEVMKTQIRRTIEEHLAKEKRLNAHGIKVLSLFFIDKVDNYRGGGKFYQWFEEIYRELTGESAEGVHNGYFSQDKKGVWKDTDGNTQADNDTYRLIMKDKETLLSFANPLRFIFSHSALKEGWDNPNVFQICTLNETRSSLKKRQEIGRGLRLPVNQQGERVRDEQINILTVIPNESYELFAATLQKEYEDECGIKFAAENIKDQSKKRTLQYRKGFSLDPEFIAVWEKLQQKTRYRVQYDTAELVRQAAQAVARLPEIQKPKIRAEKAKITQSLTYGIEAEQIGGRSYAAETAWAMPDILGGIQRKTGLTRRSVYDILTASNRLHSAADNPQRFIDLAAQAINHTLQALMTEGIVYHHWAQQIYEMALLKQMEREGMAFYENSYTFEVDSNETARTIYQNFIPLDSDTEHDFARDCENNENVAFYFKLPHWFKIPTPLGAYNPDWAVVLREGEKVYFVAETKNTGKGIQSGIDENKLRETERLKIRCAEQHFALFDGVDYRVVAEFKELV